MSGSNVATVVVTPSPGQMQQPNPAAGSAGQAPPVGGSTSDGANGQQASLSNAAGTTVSAGAAAPAAPLPYNPAANNQSASLTASPIPDPPPAQQNLNDAAGRRVRLRPKPNAMSQILGGSGLLSPLYNTNGMLFPYQPTITWSQDITYTNLETVHANQDFYSYSKTPALKLTVEGEFTVQNQTQGLYSLACIHFLRTVSKMYFGQNDPKAGTPPPVLLFDAYGQYMFNALPVIVTQFTVTLPKDVDYVGVATSYSVNNSSIISTDPALPLTPAQTATAFDNINTNQLSNYNPSVPASDQPGSRTSANAQGYAWLPAVFSISVSLVVQNTPQRLRAFNLDQFRSGQLLTQGTWI